MEVFYEPILESFPWGKEAIERFSAFNPLPKEKEELEREIFLQADDPIKKGKEILYLRFYKGEFFKKCPGTKEYICCGYWVGNIVEGCPFDCTYCVLQAYLNTPFMILNLPWYKFFEEVKQKADTQWVLRLGTGELSDSLALEPFLGFANEALSFFEGFGKGVLELKTKSSNVDILLGFRGKKRIVVAWSLAPRIIQKEQELGTSPIEERILAAKLCQEAGYPLAFHLDPIILYPGWEVDYQKLIEELFRTIEPKGVIWISLGTFRLPKSLPGIIRKRFPQNWILTGELLPAEDGKLRYLKPLRIKVYKKIFSWLKEYPIGGFIYLCMEREDVWRAVFGMSPRSTQGLKELLESHTEEFLRKW